MTLSFTASAVLIPFQFISRLYLSLYMYSEKPIYIFCDSFCLPDVFPALCLKHSCVHLIGNDPFFSPRMVVKCYFFLCLSPPGIQWHDVLQLQWHSMAWCSPATMAFNGMMFSSYNGIQWHDVLQLQWHSMAWCSPATMAFNGMMFSSYNGIQWHDVLQLQWHSMIWVNFALT